MGEATARLPKQHRSRRTLQRIARAALELIAQNGVEGTTVGAIVRRAGSSVGSFYARFDGKSDLLLYLDEHIWETVEQQWSEALADGLTDRPIDQLGEGLGEALCRFGPCAPGCQGRDRPGATRSRGRPLGRGVTDSGAGAGRLTTATSCKAGRDRSLRRRVGRGDGLPDAGDFGEPL